MSSEIKIGSTRSVWGTGKRDALTGFSGDAVFAGAGNDNLTGFSSVSSDGIWMIPSLLSGGTGNDKYTLRQGTYAIVGDAGGGNDTVVAQSMDLRNISFMRINQRDIFATDGNTSILLLDPQGIEGQANRIEKFVIGKKKFTLNKLMGRALNSNNFMGDYTYQELAGSGSMDFEAFGLNPLQISDYIQAAIHNNLLIS